MYIKNISIKNYKSLKDISINGLNNFTAIIGPNMVGKSSLIDAINFLKEGSIDSLKNALSARGKYINIVWQKKTEDSISYKMTIYFDEQLRCLLLKPFLDKNHEAFKERLYNSPFLKHLYYSLALRFDDRNQSYEEKIELEGVEKVNTRVMVIRRRLNSEKNMCTTEVNSLGEQLGDVIRGGDFGENAQQMSESNGDNIRLLFADINIYRPTQLQHNIINEFIEYTKKWYWLGPHIKIHDHVSSSATTQLNPDAQNLSGVIHTLSSNATEKMDEISEELRLIIPSVFRLSSPLEGSNTTIGMRENGQSIEAVYSLSNFSAGLKNILAMLTLLHTVDKDALVMIEEPENHLHPEAIRQLVKIYQKHAQKKQIMLTTHSSIVLQNFDIENIYLAQRNDEGNTDIKRISHENVMDVVEALGIKPSDILDHEVIAFVEGIYDEDIYRLFAQKMNIDINQVCFISTEGWNNMQYYANAAILQKRNVCPKIMAVFDGDTEKKPKAKREKKRMLEKMNVDKKNIHTLSKNEIECYLLDISTWFKTFPKMQITREKLQEQFVACEISDEPKEKMEQLLVNLDIGTYTRDIAKSITKNIAEVPDEIQKILVQAQQLVTTLTSNQNSV